MAEPVRVVIEIPRGRRNEHEHDHHRNVFPPDPGCWVSSRVA